MTDVEGNVDQERVFIVTQTPFPPDCRKNRITRFPLQCTIVDEDGQQHSMGQNRLIRMDSYTLYNEKDEELATPHGMEVIPEQYCTDRNGQFTVKCRCNMLYKEFIYIVFHFSATSFSLITSTTKTPLFQVHGRTKYIAHRTVPNPPDKQQEMVPAPVKTRKTSTHVTFQNLVPILESLSAKISEQNREFLSLLNNFEARLYAVEQRIRK